MSDIDENDEISEIDRIIQRHRDNSHYANGLIKSESVNGMPISKETIEANRKIARDFLSEIGL